MFRLNGIIRNSLAPAQGLIFDHYAYVYESQVRFKQRYYGYADAVDHWRKLQAHTDFPCKLKDFLPWVTDNAIVDTLIK